MHALTPTSTRLKAATAVFDSMVPGTQDFTWVSETKWQHSQEKHDANLEVLQALELWLGTQWWVMGSVGWEEAEKLVTECKYQWALDNLEELVVARIFEHTKMNWSQTGIWFLYLLCIFTNLPLGYALHKHIGNALKKWSAAIWAALDCYNVAARTLRPPKPTLKWDDIVEYAFLSDFDLLHDSW